ncbi:MAG: response regulator [Bacteroidota bacterium]
MKRILVVDDEDALRTVLSNELRDAGYDIVMSADGDEAIVELKKSSFDLILLDIKMPRVSGFEVLKFIKQENISLKIVMLTGFADLKNAIESKKLGASEFITKPYDLNEVLATIERLLL